MVIFWSFGAGKNSREIPKSLIKYEFPRICTCKSLTFTTKLIPITVDSTNPPPSRHGSVVDSSRTDIADHQRYLARSEDVELEQGRYTLPKTNSKSFGNRPYPKRKVIFQVIFRGELFTRWRPGGSQASPAYFPKGGQTLEMIRDIWFDSTWSTSIRNRVILFPEFFIRHII